MVSARVRLYMFILLIGLAAAFPGSTAAVGETASMDASLTPDVSSVSPMGLDHAAVGPPQATNNSSVRHEQLDNLSDAEAPAVQQWFEQYLSSQLETSVVTLDQGEYDRARSVLGDSYNEQLRKYVDVAGDTEGTDDDQTAAEFEQARDRQAEYVDAVEEYRQTRQEYETAKRNGNETRARTLARDLNQLATRIQQTGGNLTTNYETIANTSETNLTTAQNTVTRITANISTQQAEIRRDTFTNTTIEIREYSAAASFDDPLEVRGRLSAANGTALADRRVVVTLGEQTVRVRTAANGTFTASVRPTLIETGNQSASIQYVPRESAAFLGTNTTVPVTIEQNTPTLTLSNTPGSVGFNETVGVAGRVHAANVSAADVPVRLFIGATQLGTTRTNANGVFEFQTPLPAAVPAGDQRVRVTLPLENQALASVTTTAPLTVTPTATNLTIAQRPAIEAQDQSARSVRFAGTLTTADGIPVPTHTVELRVGGQTLTTTETNQTGHYAMNLTATTLLENVASDAETVTVTVVSAGDGNLDRARAQTTVSVDALAALAGEPGGDGPGGGSDGGWFPVTPWLGAAGLLVLVLVGGGVLRVVRARRRTAADEPPASATAPDATDASAGGATGPTTSPALSQVLREHAASQLEAGQPDAAVDAAYMAVRQQTVDALAWDAQQVAAQTYWEFYRRCRDHEAITAAQRTALETLTEQYERARFTPASLPDEQAADAVAAATDFLAAFDSTVTAETHDGVTDPE